MPVLNESLNWVANTYAAKIFPYGFDVSPNAPNTFDEVQQELFQTGRLSIWTGDFSNTGFGDTETWRAFRAWHDYTHARHDFKFNMPDEYGVATFQSFQTFKMLGRDDNAVDAVAQLWAELISPLETQLQGHTIPCQWKFVNDHKQMWRPFARHLSSLPVQNDSDALRFSCHARDQRAKWK